MFQNVPDKINFLIRVYCDKCSVRLLFRGGRAKLLVVVDGDTLRGKRMISRRRREVSLNERKVSSLPPVFPNVL